MNVYKDSNIGKWKPFLIGKASIIAPSHCTQINCDFLDTAEFGRSRKRLGDSCMMIVKTWTNSWYTSSRMGEKVALPCIFGCSHFQGCEEDPEDELEHYLRCHVLWKFIAATIGDAEYREHLTAVQKACLNRPTHCDLQIICVAFKAYHALKIGHSEVVQRAVKSGKFDRVHELLLDYLRCYALEASLHLYAS